VKSRLVHIGLPLIITISVSFFWTVSAGQPELGAEFGSRPEAGAGKRAGTEAEAGIEDGF